MKTAELLSGMKGKEQSAQWAQFNSEINNKLGKVMERNLSSENVNIEEKKREPKDKKFKRGSHGAMNFHDHEEPQEKNESIVKGSIKSRSIQASKRSRESQEE